MIRLTTKIAYTALKMHCRQRDEGYEPVAPRMTRVDDFTYHAELGPAEILEIKWRGNGIDIEDRSYLLDDIRREIGQDRKGPGVRPYAAVITSRGKRKPLSRRSQAHQSGSSYKWPWE